MTKYKKRCKSLFLSTYTPTSKQVVRCELELGHQDARGDIRKIRKLHQVTIYWKGD